MVSIVTEFLISFFFLLIETLIRLLPGFTIGLDFAGGMSAIVELLALVSPFMPVQALVLCVSAWFVFYGAKGIMVLVNWLIRKIPTIS